MQMNVSPQRYGIAQTPPPASIIIIINIVIIIIIIFVVIIITACSEEMQCRKYIYSNFICWPL